MPITISGSSGVTYPAGGTDNVAGSGVGTSDTQTLTNKTLTTPTIATVKSAASATPTVFQDSAGTEIGTLCRAWVNFQGGNGNSAGTRNGNFNVSSVTANGTGDYTINFTTAMPDTNFSVVGATKLADSSATTNNTIIIGPWSYATGSVRIYTTRPGDSLNNCTTVNIAVFR